MFDDEETELVMLLLLLNIGASGMTITRNFFNAMGLIVAMTTYF